MQIVVLGSGSWGTALSMILARNGHDVLLVGRDAEEMQIMASRRENLVYLPGCILPVSVKYGVFDDVPSSADAWVLAVPTAAIPEVLHRVHGDSPLVVVASKGLIPGTGQIISDYIHERLPSARLAAITGPNLAVEVARGIPTVSVAASDCEIEAEKVALLFNCPSLRVYLSGDLRGVEIAGALKNVYAISAGISDGLGFGDNTKGALVARSLYEMAKLGLAMGGRIDTFYGVAGVGDLFATANSKLSRNYRTGFALGQGKSLQAALEEINQVAEGVPTAELASLRARQLGIPAPIIESTHQVLIGRIQPKDGVSLLMDKLPRKEGLHNILEDYFKK